MKYYQEVTLRPTCEVPVNFILYKVYRQLHLGFVGMKDAEGVIAFGVSFPNYSKNGIGNIVRIFANEKSELDKLGIKKILQRMIDYVRITDIRDVPETSKFAIYRRIRKENRPEQKARRFIARHKEKAFEYEQVVDMFSINKDKNQVSCVEIDKITKLPYIKVSNDNKSMHLPHTDASELIHLPYIKVDSLTNRNGFSLFIEKTYCEKASYGGFGSYGLSNISTVPEF